jgi:hypothetical protein
MSDRTIDLDAIREKAEYFAKWRSRPQLARQAQDTLTVLTLLAEREQEFAAIEGRGQDAFRKLAEKHSNLRAAAQAVVDDVEIYGPPEDWPPTVKVHREQLRALARALEESDE